MLFPWLLVLALLAPRGHGAGSPPYTVYVNSNAPAGGDGSSERPFALITDAITAGLDEPPTTTTWTIRVQEGVYTGPGQVALSVRDTKRYIVWFENRAVQVRCNRAEFFIDFSGLGGRGALEVTGNGGSISDCMDSAIRSRRQTVVSSVVFERNRALLQGSALRVLATEAGVTLRVEGCSFQGQLQRPADAPSIANDEGGGAVWAKGLSSVSITDCQFAGNEASQGGAVYVVDADAVEIARSIFTANTALLATPGGGGLTMWAHTASTLDIWDCVFAHNNAGGTAAGFFVGGTIKVNLTRVAVYNNTSSRAYVCDSCDIGVGAVLWKHVQGVAVNCSFVDNAIEERPSVARNLACEGPLFGRSCVLRWNDGCDVCSRSLEGAQLPLAPRSAPCALSTNLWNSAAFVYALMGIVVLLALGVLGGGGYWVWRRYGRRDHYVEVQKKQRADALLEEELRSMELEPLPMPSLRSSRSVDGSVLVRSGGGGGEDDDVTESAIEPPGYGRPLPSNDFVRASPFKDSGISFKEISYEELDLDPEPIGSGAFGLVYRAMWRGSVVAVKKYIGALDAQGVQEFRAEAQLLHGVGNHPNVCRLYGACTRGPNYCLVLPYFRRGSVRQFFRTMPEEKRTWAFVRSIALQVVAGMIHLHRENIIHRDLAARNILIDDNDGVRITDFGLARFVESSALSADTKSNMGAVAWMSPEAVTKRRYSAKSDVWSFGCTLWELCTGELPFSGLEPIHVAVQVAKGATLPIPDYVPADLAAIMHACWAPQPADRPSFEELHARIASGPLSAARKSSAVATDASEPASPSTTLTVLPTRSAGRRSPGEARPLEDDASDARSNSRRARSLRASPSEGAACSEARSSGPNSLRASPATGAGPGVRSPRLK